jgi:uncharacterized protein YneF (UPF0154 family)
MQIKQKTFVRRKKIKKEAKKNPERHKKQLKK